MRPSIILIALLLALPAGAAEVRNADRPLNGDWDFSPRLVWSVDQLDGRAFDRPGELRVMEDGTCVFHEFGAHVSQIFSPDGKHVCAFASQGDQQGQLQRYLNCFISGDEIVIGTPTDLHFFTRDGRFAASYPNSLFERFPVVFLGGRVALVAPGNVSGVRGGIARITRVDFTSGKESPFAEVKIPAAGGAASGPLIVVRGLTPTIEAAWDKDSGRVYYGCSSEYLVHTVRADGESLGTFSLDRPRRSVDEAAKRAHFADSRLPADRIDAIATALPDRLASVGRLWAGHGLVYALPPAGLGRNVAAQPMDIFSADGRYLYRAELRLPGGARFSPDAAAIVGNDLYALCGDAEDHWSLRRFSISVPEAK